MPASCRAIAVGLLTALASCAGYLGQTVPSARAVAGCYAVHLVPAHVERVFVPDTLCLLPRALRLQVFGSPAMPMLAVGGRIGDPTRPPPASVRGLWYWRLAGDSLFIVESDGLTGQLIRAQQTAAGFAGLLTQFTDAGPQSDEPLAAVTGTRLP
jgi:hypothetical protein